MRRYEKNQLLESVKLLDNANNIIEKSLSIEKSQDIINLLTDCQQSAIDIGGKIEKDLKEGTKIVGLLEEYCEYVYQLSITISEQKRATRLIKQIRVLLDIIYNRIQSDIPASKREVVFLPYMASMWDSMESIWMSYKDDMDCKTYVIPIPYYEKQKDGSLGKLLYEGNQYPTYVPITSWEDYSISSRHPDVIYIHNPYDGHNRITGIHPDYYAKNLKNYTNMLVYVPYFVCYDEIPKHLCILPGTIYADKVIVQSEKHKQMYINEFLNYELENNCQGIFGRIEEKFLVLGSPKYDKVKSTRLRDIIIPDEWLGLIQKADDEFKKIVFYNTTVESLLKESELMLVKIKYVLEKFKNDNEIVLLWRPHPLNSASLTSMRPQLIEQYQEIVQVYKDEGWGIYDDTADLNRAIAISDAYYGDWSSVVALYEVTGKPIMIQNVDVIENTDDMSISIDFNLDMERRAIFNDFIENEEFIWFWAMTVNALFQVDKKTGKVKRLSEFIFKKNQIPSSYSNIIKYGPKIICIPQCSDNIAIYNLETESMHYISMDLSIWNNDSQQKGKFWGCVCKDNIAYFIGYWDSYIMKFNMETEQVEKIVDLYKDLTKKENVVYFKSGYMDKDALIIPSCIDNIVFEVDPCSLNYIIRRFDGVNNGFYSICCEGEYIWLTPKYNDPIIKWHRQTDKIFAYNDYPRDLEFGDISFGLATCSGGYLWAFPLRARKAIKVDLETGSMDTIDKVNEYFADSIEGEFYYQTYFLLHANQRKICAFSSPKREIIEYDYIKGTIRSYNYQISFEDFMDYQVFISCLNNGLVVEDRLVLEDYLDYIKRNKQRMVTLDEKTSVGKDIYNYINTLC